MSEKWSPRNLPKIYPDERFNDVFFLSDSVGWAVNGQQGAIYKTIDGGGAWKLQFAPTGAHFRSVKFVNEYRGWAGTVGRAEFGSQDSTVLYETYDGGASWGPVPLGRFYGSLPKGGVRPGFGVCGMRAVDDSTVVGVGRVRGPAFFVRTTDQGATWMAKDMGEHAAALIDVHFFDPENGIAVGATDNDNKKSHGLVLATSDGGETWEKRYKTSRPGEWCWKTYFLTEEIGFVALQRNEEGFPINFLKTRNGGLSWDEKLFSKEYYFVQGIGFATEKKGWIGGAWDLPTRQTEDGGETWTDVPESELGLRVNRFQFLSESLGFAAGSDVYRYR
jgi:photosystem II stability/assembly factor-like uncharacterized protein